MRLIDADKLLDDFQIWPICDDCAQLEDTECELSGMYICKAIQNAPTVDAVSVVRCKDCRYWRQEVDSTTHWVCIQHSIGELLRHTTPDHFCACGLKCKEGEA